MSELRKLYTYESDAHQKRTVNATRLYEQCECFEDLGCGPCSCEVRLPQFPVFPVHSQPAGGECWNEGRTELTEHRPCLVADQRRRKDIRGER